jgi:hypothetical protein
VQIECLFEVGEGFLLSGALAPRYRFPDSGRRINRPRAGNGGLMLCILSRNAAAAGLSIRGTRSRNTPSNRMLKEVIGSPRSLAVAAR